jgi:DNA polymerase-1
LFPRSQLYAASPNNVPPSPWLEETTAEISSEIQQTQECAIVLNEDNVFIATQYAVYGDATSSLLQSSEKRNAIIQWLGDESIHKWVFDVKKMGHLLSVETLDEFRNTDDVQLLYFLVKPNAKQYTIKDFQSEAEDTPETNPAQTVLHKAPLFWSDVEKWDELELYTATENPLSKVLYKMEKKGVKISPTYIEKIQKEIEQKIATLQKEIHELAGEEFNIASPKQLGFILFEKMGLPSGRKTKTGYSTDAEVLENIKGASPIVEKILSYRECSKMVSTYMVGLQKTANSEDMIHTTYLQAGPATGRISSIHPNMQNLPSDSHWGQTIKEAFIVRNPDNIFLSADYSQIDLRVLAHYSQDTRMTQAFREGNDIHSWTARQIFGIDHDREVSREYRNIAKTVNFGVIYGMTPHGLSQALHISTKEAKQFIDMYFRTFPGIRDFTTKAVQFAKDSGYAITLLGRRRPIPELQSSNHIVRSFGERLAVNTVIQGTSADIIKKAMISIDATLQESFQTQMILQIHDEIITEGPASEQNEVEQWIQKIMTTTTSLNVPLNIQLHQGKTLAALKS